MAACLQQTHFIKLKIMSLVICCLGNIPQMSEVIPQLIPAVWSGQDMQYPNLLHEMQKYLLIPKNPCVSRRLEHPSIHQTSGIPKVERNRAENVEHILITNQHSHTLIFTKTVHYTLE
jgi:hypothetical protein